MPGMKIFETLANWFAIFAGLILASLIAGFLTH